ncbi:MAG: efflux RND transporter periplasmic adaptor subunit [Gammaproteobacteria bacterium]|nr:efflux RND transporter periplasmic adaptor subunit [Gammaproteobacteria bacterium]
MKVLKVMTPLLVLALSISIAYFAVATKPEPERRLPQPTIPSVDAIRATPSDYQVLLKAHGTVQPRTESTLISEVAGRVVEVLWNFRDGGFFEAGDVLLRIDPSDYEIAVIVAESNLARARLALEEEKARAAQAGRDWERLGEGGEPSELVLRKPQLVSAQAAIAAAKAEVERARLNLGRTTIAAPYAGRVLQQSVDVGQYASSGSELARIYAVDYVEIRLPLTNAQLEHVDLPEQYRGEASESSGGPAVTIKAQIGRKKHQWQGLIVRTEGAIDTKSRQTFVVAQVDDPYGKSITGNPPLKVGQFVEAEIKGHTLRNAFVLPSSALRLGGALDVVTQENQLSRREVEIVWRDADHVVIQNGLSEGELISLTPLGFSGPTRVAVTIVNDKGNILRSEYNSADKPDLNSKANLTNDQANEL